MNDLPVLPEDKTRRIRKVLSYFEKIRFYDFTIFSGLQLAANGQHVDST